MTDFTFNSHTGIRTESTVTGKQKQPEIVPNESKDCQAWNKIAVAQSMTSQIKKSSPPKKKRKKVSTSAQQQYNLKIV